MTSPLLQTLAVCLAIAALAPRSAVAATYFVRSTGSDTADGRTPATAFASIRKAAAAVLNPGDRIVVGPGSYAEGDIGPANNGIANRPVVFVADASGAETGDPAGPVTVVPPAPFSTGFLLLGRRGVTIDGFTVRGATDACVQVRTSADGTTASEAIVLRNLDVANCSKRGIDVTAVGAVTIEDNRAAGSVTGISVLGPGGAGPRQDASLGGPAVTVQRNQVVANTGPGIVVERASGGGILDNTVLDNATTGIIVRASDTLDIWGNDVRRNRDGGIQAGLDSGDSGVSDVEIAANRVEDNVGAAIDMHGAGTLSVRENEVISAGGVAISVAGFGGNANAIVAGNGVTGGGSHGVYVADAAAGTVRDNAIADVAGHGILLDRSSGVALADNAVARVVFAGIRARASADLVARGNTVIGAADGGINLEADGSVEIRANSVRDSGDSGLAVAAAAAGSSALVSDNLVRNSEVHGVFATGTATVRVVGNDIATSGQTGINLPDMRDATVAGNVVRFSVQDAVRATGGGAFTAQANRLEDNLGSAILVEAVGGLAFDLDITGNEMTRQVHGVFVRGCSGGAVAANVVRESSQNGILLRQCTGVHLAGNDVAASGAGGIVVNAPEEPAGRAFSLRRNRVAQSGANGIAVYARGDVVASGNDVATSGPPSSALSVITGGRARVALSNNLVRGSGAHGIFVRGADRGVLQNSVVHSSADTGVTMRDSTDMLVANNLIYANATDGLAIGTGGGASPRAVVGNNTLYANGARGFVLGSGGVASPGARLFNNVIEANGDVGVAVDRLSAEGFVAGFNVNSDGYGEDTPVSPFDLLGPAGFVAPAGGDGRLGGSDDSDDDFRLRQVRGGQDADGIAVDAGSAATAAIGLTGSTATGGAPDIDQIDAGYHYDAAEAQLVSLPPAWMPLYVRASGNDANDGRDPQQALASIRRAGILAASGATVVVGPGRYLEPEAVRVRQGAAQVTFLADRSGERTGEPAGPVIIDAAGGDNAFVVRDADEVTIDGFHVTNSATAAIQIRDGADRAVVRNNVVFSNQRRGIEIRGADAGLIDNNLVYANGTGGIQLQETRGSEVSGNTVYGNGENGITVGGSAVVVGRLDRVHAAGEDGLDIWLGSSDASRSLAAGDQLELPGSAQRYRVVADAASAGGLLTVAIDPPLIALAELDAAVTDQTLSASATRVQRNVVAANALGILAQINSLDGYECGGNVVEDGLPGKTPRCDSDILGAPDLVDPAGPDRVLGGAGFADDDFRLWQDTSPAVDLTPCGEGLLPPAGTTHPQGLADECPIDSGYHYPLFLAGTGFE
jgi:parallel beta-helix repeat protein